LGSIVILFICALSFLIRSNFFFAFEPVVTPTATGDLTRPAIELTSVVIEITGTPTPPPTATRRDEQNEGEASDDPEDSDGDGLSDEEEAIYGTNPYLEDSDFDGIDDFTEIFVLAIEPLNFDTDGDGLWDGEDDDPLQAATATSAPIVTSLPDITATPQTAVPHTVQTGETLALIAEQYGISMGQLVAINGLAAEDSLQVGQQLLIPLKANVLVLELVVKVPAVDLYSGPGDEYEVVAQLPRGTFATILGQTFDPAWYLVKVQDRSASQGWLSAAVVRLLYPTQPEMIPLVTPPPLP
jgi:LysM repeat protein